MILILFFIIVLNLVALGLTYYCLNNMEKKDKIIFIAIGVGVIYILTSLVYWISTKGIEIKEVSEMGKNLITFLFVPVNSIFVLPLLAKSYNKYKIGKLASDKLRNRGIVLGVILAILLVIECSYFKDIQNSVVTIIENNYVKKQALEQIRVNEVLDNLAQNQEAGNLTNNVENTVNEANQNVVNNVTMENKTAE